MFIRLFEWLSVRQRRPDLAALQELVAPTPDVRLLDIGGGGGTMTRLYASGCREVVVLDPDRRKVAYGRRKHRDVTFAEGRAEEIPFPDASFDRAVGIVSFHHTEEPDQALDEIRRVLKPDGRLVLFELRPEEHGGAGMRILGRRMHGTAPHFYAPHDLRDLLASRGFRAIGVRDGVRGYFVTAMRQEIPTPREP